MKDIKRAERVFKGVANRIRLEILVLLGKNPELSVVDISDRLKSELRNVSQHLLKMEAGGIVMKRHEGNFVRLALTNRGKSILQFYRIME